MILLIGKLNSGERIVEAIRGDDYCIINGELCLIEKGLIASPVGKIDL